MAKMSEEQKDWQISVKMSSKKCKFKEHYRDLSEGKYNNFGEYRCGHQRNNGMLCCVTRQQYCPLKDEPEYPMNPELQVNKDDV